MEIAFNRLKKEDIPFLKELLWHRASDALFGKIEDGLDGIWHTDRFLEDKINSAGVIFLKAEDSGKIIGALFAEEIDNKLILKMLFIHPGYRRKGAAGGLLKKLEASRSALDSILVEVEKINLRAVSFYLKQGFKIIKPKNEFKEGTSLETLILLRRKPRTKVRG